MRAVRSLSKFFLLTLLTLPAFPQKFNADSLAPYIPSPQIVVDRMLEMAHIKPGETVYDLGSGDGRILITAAQKFRAKAVGIELSPELCQSTAARIEKLGLQDLVKVMQANLLTSSNARLKPNLEKYLRPGARVVSNDFEIRGWTPKDISTLKVQGMPHTIYLYQIGKKGS